MDALTFLYWALGGGFLMLVLFIVISLIYVIRILRDVSDATSSVRNSAEVINDNVIKVAEKITETAEQVTEYIIKPVSMAQYFLDKVKPFFDMIQQKSEEMSGGNGDKSSSKKSKESIFKRRKK